MLLKVLLLERQAVPFFFMNLCSLFSAGTHLLAEVRSSLQSRPGQRRGTLDLPVQAKRVPKLQPFEAVRYAWANCCSSKSYT
jgi:hypothetical protein